MSQHGVAKAGHVEKRRQRSKLFEKLENQTPFLGKFVQMRVQGRPAEQGGHGNPSHTVSSKVRATFYTNPPKTRNFPWSFNLYTVRPPVQWVLVKLHHLLARQHLLTLL